MQSNGFKFLNRNTINLLYEGKQKHDRQQQWGWNTNGIKNASKKAKQNRPKNKKTAITTDITFQGL